MRFADVILRDTRANQPAANTVSEGTIYYVTDENVTERSSGSAWEDISDGGSTGITQLTGDATAGPGSGSQALTLANTAVTPGTYGDDSNVAQITVDSKGRITGVNDVPITGGGGGGLVLLSEKIASASASLDFTTEITSLYDDYMFRLLSILPATNSVDLRMLVSTDGGSSWASSNYVYAINHTNAGSGAVGVISSAAGSAFPLATTVGNAGMVSGYVNMHDPLNAALDKGFRLDTALKQPSPNFWYSFTGSLWYANAAAINAIRFIMSSGNITSGKIRLYGLEKP